MVGCRNPSEPPTGSRWIESGRIRPLAVCSCRKHIKVGVNRTGAALPPAPAGTSRRGVFPLRSPTLKGLPDTTFMSCIVNSFYRGRRRILRGLPPTSTPPSLPFLTINLPSDTKDGDEPTSGSEVSPASEQEGVDLHLTSGSREIKPPRETKTPRSESLMSL